MPTPVLADTRLLGAAHSTTYVDAKRAGLLAATRSMTVLVMAVLPIFAIALVVVWSFRSADWSPVLLVVVTAATVLSCAVAAELWRRLARLSDLTTLNEELRYRASHDLLMHVPNRDLLQVELAEALAASGGKAGTVGLLFLDLDRFKFVNDSLGHAAGDELLKAAGLRIKRAIADENAVLARVGGDELVVLMRRLTSFDHLGSVSDRLLAKFVDPFMIDGVQLSIGTSIGLAVCIDHESADELYRHADAALTRRRSEAEARLCSPTSRYEPNGMLESAPNSRCGMH